MDGAAAEVVSSAGVDVVEVLGLDAAGALSFCVEAQRRAQVAEAEQMRAVCHYTDLHRTGGVGAIDPEVERWLTAPSRGGTWARESHLGVEGELRLAGEGAFMIEEFAVCEVAAALGMSESAARAYVGQSIEVRDRLPRLWHRVMKGELPAWRARRVAEQTIPLNAAAAAYVDAQLAPFAHKLSWRRALRAVEAAMMRHDPELAAQRARDAAEKRGVWIDDYLNGTSGINAVANTPDAAALDAALNAVATTLGALGDNDSHQVRRTKALGILADPQHALDLTTQLDERGASPAPRPEWSGGPVLHIHLHTDAVQGALAEDSAGHVARVDRFGPRALETVAQWIADLSPAAVVKVTPVVDLGERIAVDAYEIPDRLRAQVEERDTCCVFPWCGREGRHDLDHIEAFHFGDPHDPDAKPPPAQTNTDGLARLCRFHHRVKTTGGWSYHREPAGTLMWVSPLGRRYAVDHTGTTPRG